MTVTCASAVSAPSSARERIDPQGAQGAPKVFYRFPESGVASKYLIKPLTAFNAFRAAYKAVFEFGRRDVILGVGMAKMVEHFVLRSLRNSREPCELRVVEPTGELPSSETFELPDSVLAASDDASSRPMRFCWIQAENRDALS